MYQITKTKTKDWFDIKKCIDIWPTDQIHASISQQVINNADFKISLKNPNFEDQMTEAKIRYCCDIRRYTPAQEGIHVFIL